MTIRGMQLALKSLCAYKSLEVEPVIEDMVCLLEHLNSLDENPETEWLVDSTLGQYGAVFYQLRQGGYKGFGDFLWDYFRYCPTLYGKMVTEGTLDPALENSARREVENLILLAKLDCDTILGIVSPYLPEEQRGMLSELPRWSTHCTFDFEDLTAFHKERGYGQFAKHQQFLWRRGQLLPVTRIEPVSPAHMKGYEFQRSQVMENTQKLIGGHHAQNILLFGDGGTGKSAVVKSMAHVEGFSALRLIQVENHSVAQMTDLLALLPDKPYKYILFIDDLAFDHDDDTYSALKSVLEGGLETPPHNVVVYATSNRRHLVRQSFADRAGDEVDMMETISEKTSLSERFGLRIPYLSMTKGEYLDLVDFLYDTEVANGESALPYTQEERHHKAMMWEIRHGGRTPRVAQQFITSLF